jgi:hypothetical protein
VALNRNYNFLKLHFDDDRRLGKNPAYAELESYFSSQDLINSNIDEEAQKIEEAQEAFAKKYNVKVISEGKSQTEVLIEETTTLMRYYNQVYLAFYRCLVAENNYLEAFEQEQLSALSQKEKALASAFQQSNQHLEQLGAYKGDASLNQQCKKILLHFKTEIEPAPALLQALLSARSKFETAKETFESIPESERSIHDIEQYNLAAKTYNEAVLNLNAYEESMSSNRRAKLKLWHNQSNDFLQQHAPQ